MQGKKACIPRSTRTPTTAHTSRSFGTWKKNNRQAATGGVRESNSASFRCWVNKYSAADKFLNEMEGSSPIVACLASTHRYPGVPRSLSVRISPSIYTVQMISKGPMALATSFAPWAKASVIAVMTWTYLNTSGSRRVGGAHGEERGGWFGHCHDVVCQLSIVSV